MKTPSRHVLLIFAASLAFRVAMAQERNAPEWIPILRVNAEDEPGNVGNVGNVVLNCTKTFLCIATYNSLSASLTATGSALRLPPVQNQRRQFPHFCIV